MTEPVDVNTLAVALIGENALVRAGDTQYQLNEQNALNASIDTVVDLIVKMVNELLKEFYPEILINISAPRCVDIQTGIAERKIQVEPADLVTLKLRNTLLKTIMLTTKGLIEGADSLFAAPIKSALTTDELDFINEWTKDQLRQKNGRKIAKPAALVLHFSDEKTVEIPIQGAFAPPPKLPADSSQPVEVLAKADGFKASSMQVFLRLVDKAGYTLDNSSITCLADKSSQIQLAAQAYLDGNQLLKATIVGIEDEKGKKNGSQYNIIKDLKTIPLDQLSKEGELQF
ncbi:hypothetical protein P6F15_05215 [Thiopseudomonas alkaliphila]|uniref:hypothetical protein n=1 Tax=Thiopseudomonas alkaliphila TaxID=1697053 RepID=UPI0035712030